jgi:hypothetical protein
MVLCGASVVMAFMAMTPMMTTPSMSAIPMIVGQNLFMVPALLQFDIDKKAPNAKIDYK